MFRSKFFIAITAFSAILAGQVMASETVVDNAGPASKTLLKLVPTQPPLIPTSLDSCPRTLIFDFAARSPVYGRFDHETLRSLEMVNIATAEQVRAYRKLRHVLPRIVISIPTQAELLEMLLLSDLIEMFRLSDVALPQNNGMKPLWWQIQSTNPMGLQNMALSVIHDELKADRSAITFRNFYIGKQTENSLRLICQLTYERRTYNSRKGYLQGNSDRELISIELNRTILLPENADVNFSTLMPRPREPNSILQHAATFRDNINYYPSAKKKDLTFKLDQNANNGQLASVPEFRPPLVSTSPDDSISLSQEGSSLTISAPGREKLIQMLGGAYANSAQADLSSPEGWNIVAGRSCDFHILGGSPYDYNTKQTHLRNGVHPKLMSVYLRQVNGKASLLCEYVYRYVTDLTFRNKHPQDSFTILYKQQVTLPENCVIIFPPIQAHVLALAQMISTDNSVEFRVDRLYQEIDNLADGFKFVCSYKIFDLADVD